MIQRIQTLFLALSVIALIAMAFYPVMNVTEFTNVSTETLETDYYQILITGISDPSPDSLPQLNSWAFIPLLIITLFIILLVIYAITRFKQRLHQLKLIKISIFMNIILVAGIFLNYPKFFTDNPIRIEIGPGAYFTLISLVLLVAANRYVIKDEKLVRSADRLR
jgi:uncharacterized membrane protein YhaH (DUF805 family)